MAIEYREIGEDNAIHIKAGETLLNIVPIWTDGIPYPIWCAEIQVPGEVISFAKEKEKRDGKS